MVLVLPQPLRHGYAAPTRAAVESFIQRTTRSYDRLEARELAQVLESYGRDGNFTAAEQSFDRLQLLLPAFVDAVRHYLEQHK